MASLCLIWARSYSCLLIRGISRYVEEGVRKGMTVVTTQMSMVPSIEDQNLLQEEEAEMEQEIDDAGQGDIGGIVDSVTSLPTRSSNKL